MSNATMEGRSAPASGAATERDFAGGASPPAHANYDVTPDGKRFVTFKPMGAEAQLIVVHDWKYELRERTASVRRK